MLAPSEPSEGGDPWNAWSAARSLRSTSSNAPGAADGDARLEGLGAGLRARGGAAWLAHPRTATSKTATPSLTEALQSVRAREFPPRAPESRRSAESQTGARPHHPGSSPSLSCPPARAAAGDYARR